MNRNLLKLQFSKDNTPDWICPTCNKGTLKIKEGTFHQEECLSSRELHSDEAWEPDWIKYIYTSLLICSNDKCKEIVATSGTGSVSWYVSSDEYGEPEETGIDFFEPKYFNPHLLLIKIPNQCPKTVSNLLNDSFKLFFLSPSAAANNIRAAIEELLTALKIKRYSISNRKRRFINLHKRIDLLPQKYASFKEMILAVKWLGNAGSHGDGELTMDDVMDAYELTEHILTEIYTPKVEKLTAIAKQVNKRKGPKKIKSA